MRLVEQHVISRADRRFKPIDCAAFASKNLYNKALYATRQAFFQDGSLPSYSTLYHQMKGDPEYAALPRKVAQWVLKQVCAAWDSYAQALAAYEADPSTFVGRPRLPRYKDKQQGRNLLVYTLQALSLPALRNHMIRPSGLGITVQTRQENIQQVRIIPRSWFYIVEVIYEQKPIEAKVIRGLHAGVDIGLNNLAVLTSDKPGFVPRVVNGRPVKSINQFYTSGEPSGKAYWGTLGRASAWNGSPQSGPGGSTGTCTPLVGTSLICWWTRASPPSALARTRCGSRKRTWGNAAIKTS